MTTIPVRLGVIGCGFIGTMHLEAAATSASVEVVAIADVRPGAAEQAAAAFGGAVASYDRPEALLGDPNVEAVLLAIPTRGRAQLALDTFAAGKHLLLEKPPALDADELRPVLAARGGLVGASCTSRFRHSPAARAATEFLVGRGAAPIRVVRRIGTRSAPPKPASPAPAWRLSRALNGGGILANWGCYDLDYMLGVTGWTLQPTSVFARTYGVPAPVVDYVDPESDAETHAIVTVTCAGGETLVLQRSEYIGGGNEDEICVIGEQGTMRWNVLQSPDKSIVHGSIEPTTGTRDEILWRGDDSHDQQASVQDDFARAIRDGTPPMTSLEQALVVQSVLDASYRSSAEGRVVDIAREVVDDATA